MWRRHSSSHATFHRVARSLLFAQVLLNNIIMVFRLARNVWKFEAIVSRNDEILSVSSSEFKSGAKFDSNHFSIPFTYPRPRGKPAATPRPRRSV